MKTNAKNQSSKKPLLAVLVLIVVLVIAGIVWFIVTRSNNDDSANDNRDETSQTANTFKGTMFDARNRTTDGKSLECDWTLDYEGEALLSKGKIYANGKGIVRSTATFESEGKTHESNTVLGKD